MFKKMVILSVFLAVFIPLTLNSTQAYENERESYYRLQDMIRENPGSADEILRNYSLRGTVYECPDFDPARDCISFENFGLDSVRRSGSLDFGFSRSFDASGDLNDYNSIEGDEYLGDDFAVIRVSDMESPLDFGLFELTPEILSELSRSEKDWGLLEESRDEEYGEVLEDLEYFANQGGNGNRRALINNALSKMGWAHCFGMSYFVKQFHEKANMVNNPLVNDEISRNFNRIGKKMNAEFYGRSLWEISRQYDNQLMKELVPLQKRLFFNPISLGLLLPHNQEKSLNNIKNELKKGNLVLIGLKKSLSWMHVVVGYRVEEDDDAAMVYIYDSNFPTSSANRRSKLVYDKSKKKFHAPDYSSDMSVFRIDR